MWNPVQRPPQWKPLLGRTPWPLHCQVKAPGMSGWNCKPDDWQKSSPSSNLLGSGAQASTGLCFEAQCRGCHDELQHMVETEGPIHRPELTDRTFGPAPKSRDICDSGTDSSFGLHHFQSCSWPGAYPPPPETLQGPEPLRLSYDWHQPWWPRDCIPQ